MSNFIPSIIGCIQIPSKIKIKMSKPFNNFREINIGGEQSKMPSEKKHSKGCLEGQVMYLIGSNLNSMYSIMHTYLYQHIEVCLRNKSKLFRIHIYISDIRYNI